MYVCVECGTLFEQPKHFIETHGFTYPPYEEWDGCPDCSGVFIEAHECDCCGEYITGDYIKTDNDKRFCESCFCVHELGDER
jgi:hypothetical protein